MTVEEKVDVVIGKILPEILRRLKEQEPKAGGAESVGPADLEAVRQGAMRQMMVLSKNVQDLAARMDKVEDGVANRREETELLNGLSGDAAKEMSEVKAQLADLRADIDTLVKVVGTLSEERPKRGRRKRGDAAAALPDNSEWKVVEDVAGDDAPVLPTVEHGGVFGSEM